MSLKKYLPKFVIDLYRLKNLLIDFFYDFTRYAKHSATFSYRGKMKLEGRITAHYHVIEKGLSFKEIKLGYGQDMVRGLIFLLKKWENKYSNGSSKQIVVAYKVLSEYFDLHKKRNHSLPEKLVLLYASLNPIHDRKEEGGSKIILRDDVVGQARGNFECLANSRHSIREYTDEEVDIELIKKAVTIAQRSPSVCNRQSSKVYVVSKKEDIIKHLKFQNGNRGFGHKIGKLLIITSDLQSFESSLERNQSYVDGGIFAMSLLYALHFLGLGAVSLNWSAESSRDRRYKNFSKIPYNQNIITMMGVGHIPRQLNIPVSARKELNEVLELL